MPSTKGQHLIKGSGTAGRRTRDRLLALDETGCRNFQRLEYRTHHMKTAFRRQGTEQSGNVQGNIDRGNDKI